MKTKTITTSTVIAAVCLLSAVCPTQAQQNDTGKGTENRGQLSARDYRFVREAARGGMEEVQLGQLAQQKGTSQSVKDFGQRMVTDHNKANDELKQIVSQKGATFPATLTRRENSAVDDLQKLTGKDFDKKFASQMVKDHKTDVHDFEDAVKDLTDPDLKAFAQKTLPTLQEHLRLAQDMENSAKSE